MQRQQQKIQENEVVSVSDEIKPSTVDDNDEELEQRENEMFFCPEKGNVAFCSAKDCWAFNLTTFARKIAPRFGMNPRILQQYLWGDFFYSSTEKKIYKTAKYENSRQMFV